MRRMVVKTLLEAASARAECACAARGEYRHGTEDEQLAADLVDLYKLVEGGLNSKLRRRKSTMK